MGGGGFLNALTSGLGGAGSEASGIGGGIFGQGGMQSPPPLPPSNPAPNPIAAASAGLNHGLESPQMNALQLAFGQSVIDPLTGSPVPSGSTTGNNVPSGPTAMGLGAAAGELAKAPQQAARQAASLAGPDVLKRMEGVQASMSPDLFGEGEDLPPRPPGQAPGGGGPGGDTRMRDLFDGGDLSSPADLPLPPPVRMLPQPGQEQRYPSAIDRAFAGPPREPAPANGPPIGPGMQPLGRGLGPEVRAPEGPPPIIQQAFADGVKAGSAAAGAPVQLALDGSTASDVPVPGVGQAGQAKKTGWDWQSLRPIDYYEDRIRPGYNQDLRDPTPKEAAAVRKNDWPFGPRHDAKNVPEVAKPLPLTPLEVAEHNRRETYLKGLEGDRRRRLEIGDDLRDRSSYYRATIQENMAKNRDDNRWLGVMPEYPDRMAQRDPNPGGYSYITEYDTSYKPNRRGSGASRIADIREPGNLGLDTPELPAPLALPPRDTGNIDLTKRPLVPNQGGYSTVNSVTFNEDGKAVVVPGVSHDGKSVLSPDQAIEQYHKSGSYLGKFETDDEANAYARGLHDSQAKLYGSRIASQTARDQMAGAESLAAPVSGAATGTQGQKRPQVIEDAFTPITRESVVMPPRMQGGAGDYRPREEVVPAAVEPDAGSRENARIDAQMEANQATPTWWRRYTGTGAFAPGQPLAEAERISPPPAVVDTSRQPVLTRQMAGGAGDPRSALAYEDLPQPNEPRGGYPSYAERQAAARSGQILPPTSIAGQGAAALTEFGDRYPLRGRESLTPGESYGQFGLGGIWGPEPQGPPIPAPVAASGATPGAVRYELPGEGGARTAPAAKPTSTIHIDKDGNVSYGAQPNPFTGPPQGPPAPAPLPPPTPTTSRTEAPMPAREPEPVPAPQVRIPPRAGVYQETGRPQGPMQPIPGFTPEEGAALEGSNPDLMRVVRRAATDNPNLFRLSPGTRDPYTGSAVRTAAQQARLKAQGGPAATTSLHQAGNAIDLVPINPKTMQPDYDYQSGYADINRAMQDAARKEGVAGLTWGGDWKNVDRPHFEIAGQPRGPQGPTTRVFDEGQDLPAREGPTPPAAPGMRRSSGYEPGPSIPAGEGVYGSQASSPTSRYFDFAYRKESGGDNAARSPVSSAATKAQFIKSTWLKTVDAMLPASAAKMSTEDKMTLQSDPDFVDSAMLLHTKFNVGQLQAAGVEPTDRNVFLAHRLGDQAAINVIKNPNDPIANHVSAAAIANNPDLRTTGANFLSSIDAQLERSGTGSVGSTAIASDPRIAGTEKREVAEAIAQASSGTVAQAQPPAGTVQQPGGRVTTPGGRIIPQQQPLQAPAPPAKLPDPKTDPTAYRKAIEELKPAQVVRMTDQQKLFGRLAGIFRGMAGGKTWGDTMMGGAAGGMGARAHEADQEVANRNLENERDFQYRQRKAAMEGELMKIDQQNKQGDVNAANVNAERAYEAQKYNTVQQQSAANANEQAAATALNAEREEGKPKVTVSQDGGITIQKLHPDGSMDVQHTPGNDLKKEFDQVKEMSELFKKGDVQAQAEAYKYLGQKYGSDGIKLQLLGDIAQNSRYAQVFGGNKVLLDRLKKVATDANKLLPAAAQLDPKASAEAQEYAVKQELIRLWQSGQLGEGWIGDMARSGNPGAMLLTPRQAAPAAGPARGDEPSGLGQGAAFQ